VFLKVGQIDTRNERYDAEAYIECYWEDDQIFRVLADPNMAKNGNLKYNFETKQKKFLFFSYFLLNKSQQPSRHGSYYKTMCKSVERKHKQHS
jgi:hypothetical protein